MYALDDAVNGIHSPEQGARNADIFISDPAVLAIVGPFNTSVAQAEMPFLNVAGLAQISPSTNSVSLTDPKFVGGALRPTGKVTYFRIPTPDDLEGYAAADFMFDRLNVRRLVVLDDTELYGKLIADSADTEFRARGGLLAAHYGVPKGTMDFSTVFSVLMPMHPDGLFYGGTSSDGVSLARKQMRASGLDIPFVGGDGMMDADFIDQVGPESVGSYALTTTINARKLPTAQQFLRDYRNRFGQEIGTYSANAYEATNIIIDAMRRAGKPDREAVRAAIATTNGYSGILGTTSFDSDGDTTNKWISIYQVKDDGQGPQWTYLDQMQMGK